MCSGTEDLRKQMEEARANSWKTRAQNCCCSLHSCPKCDWDVVPCWVGRQAESLDSAEADHGSYADTAIGE